MKKISPTPTLPHREGVANRIRSYRNNSAPSLWGRVGVGLLCLALFGCIEPYDAKLENIDSILVVEGFITSGTTQINLSKSIGVNDNYWNYYQWVNGKYVNTLVVDHAIVYVECDDGTQSEKAHSSGEGIYLIETGELNVNAKYRLAIHMDDEVYHSSYIAPAISPPVELSYRINYHYFINQKNEPDSTIYYTDVLVSTQGYEHQPGYYLWSYKEDWEIHDLFGYDICWRKDSSRVFLLGSTEKLIDNTIRDHTLLNIWGDDNRVSQYYRMQVKQNTIHKEAYDYFNNQKKNSEKTGSIFGVIPSELMGNIKCTSNPAIFVIGYVDVSTTTTNELFLDRECFNPQYENSQRMACYNEEDGSISPSCLDCTQRGGTKNKPKDWPNDHY